MDKDTLKSTEVVLMYWLQISLLYFISPKKLKDINCLSCSQPPNVALALSASWEQLVLVVAADRLAAALPGTVEGA